MKALLLSALIAVTVVGKAPPLLTCSDQGKGL
jgi:hypothetical protein